MPSPYNLTEIGSGGSSPVGLIQGLNTASGGLLGIGMLLSFFIITFLLLIRGGNFLDDSLAASSYATAVMALLLWIIDIIQDLGIYIALALLIAGFVLQSSGRT